MVKKNKERRNSQKVVQRPSVLLETQTEETNPNEVE